jgi:hypothetical protein
MQNHCRLAGPVDALPAPRDSPLQATSVARGVFPYSEARPVSTLRLGLNLSTPSEMADAVPRCSGGRFSTSPEVVLR